MIDELGEEGQFAIELLCSGGIQDRLIVHLTKVFVCRVGRVFIHAPTALRVHKEDNTKAKS